MNQWLLSFALIAIAGVCTILFAVVLRHQVAAADDRSAAELMMAAVSVLALRHGTLPRWLAILGFPLAALQLANAVAPMAALVLWSRLVGVTLSLRKTRPHVIAPTPEHALT